MKRIETIVKPYKVDEVKAALVKEGIENMTFTEVGAFSQHSGYVKVYRGVKEEVDILPKMRIEVIVRDDQVKMITNVIIAALREGRRCDGQVTVLPVEDVIHIRSTPTGVYVH